MALDPEVLWITLPPLGWLLWSAGGTWWKPLRRVGLPLLTGLLLCAATIPPLQAIAVLVCASAAFHLGYGSKYDGYWWSWPYRALLGAAYGGSLLWIHPVWWPPVIMSAAFVGLFLLSRRWNRFEWKIVEGATGGLWACLAVWLTRSALGAV